MSKIVFKTVFKATFILLIKNSKKTDATNEM